MFKVVAVFKKDRPYKPTTLRIGIGGVSDIVYVTDDKVDVHYDNGDLVRIFLPDEIHFVKEEE